MPKNYYDILGIQKTASKDEVKKAFRTLAHKYHPDKKGGDEAKFKEVNEAFSVLSDDKKRAEYDTYGRVFSGAGAGAGAGGGFNGFEGFDFSQFTQGGVPFDDFDLGDIFGSVFGGGRSRTKRGRDISADIEITFEESVFGADRKLLITKASVCDICKGTGAGEGSKLETCKTCNGKGRVHESRRSFLGAITMERTCSTCHGQGKVPDKLCGQCKGEGILQKQEEVLVKIPAGIDDGEMIRLSGAGEAIRGGSSGDLYIKIHVKKHATFRKEGSNLLMNLSVKLSDALLGAKYTLKTLDGDIELKIPESVNHGEILRVKGKGVPVGRNRGDLLIKVQVEMPKKLSKKAREEIEKLKEEGI